jgi:AAA domain
MDGIPPIIPPLQSFEEFQRETEIELAATRFQIARFGTIKPDSTAQYLVKGLLQSTGLAIVWGPPKCGKSFWVFDLLMHVALDWTYRGHRVTPGPVVYCALEGAQGHKNRIEAFRRGKMSEAADSDPLFYLMSTPLSLVRDHKAFVADISKQLGDLKPVAVCIDTLNRSLEGSESSDEDMSAYVRAADAIRDAFGCLVIIVHHCGHGGDRPRGHSSLMGALDVQIAVRRDATDNIVAELELSKDGETGLQFVSRLKVVEIGTDQDGDPITSCVIEAVDAPAGAPKAPAKGRMSDVEMIKRAIVDAHGRLAADVEPSPGFDGALVRKVPVDKLRDEIKSRGFLETEDDDKLTSTARSNFRRAKSDLIAAKSFIEADKQFWRLFESPSETKPERTPF